MALRRSNGQNRLRTRVHMQPVTAVYCGILWSFAVNSPHP